MRAVDRLGRWGVLLAFGLIAALAPGAARAALPPAFGGELTAAAEGPLEARDGARARTDAELLYAEAVHCSVADLLSEVPETSEDGRQVTLHLRPQLYFHDGAPLTAEDVARSLMRLADPGFGGVATWRLLPIEGVAERLDGVPALPAIRAVNDRTLVLDLAVPQVDVAAMLDDPRVPVVARDGRTGCGPFRPARGAAEGGGARLEAFLRHAQGRPFLDRLVLQPTSAADVRPGQAAVVVGDAARSSETTAEGGAHATFLTVEAKDRPDLARRLAPTLDRETMARLLVSAGARAFEGAPPAREASLPKRLTLRYAPDAPAQRAVAERIQLRLYDAGTAVRLVTDGPADLALVRLSVPADPVGLAVAASFRFGAAREARAALAELAGTPAAARRDRALGLLSELPAVPLYLEPGHLRARPEVLGIQSGRAAPVGPAELWLWPLHEPPPPSR